MNFCRVLGFVLILITPLMAADLYFKGGDGAVVSIYKQSKSEKECEGKPMVELKLGSTPKKLRFDPSVIPPDKKVCIRTITKKKAVTQILNMKTCEVIGIKTTVLERSAYCDITVADTSLFSKEYKITAIQGQAKFVGTCRETEKLEGVQILDCPLPQTQQKHGYDGLI